MASSVIAAVMAAQARYLRIFEQAGAVDPAHSRTLDELGLRETGLFRGLVRRGLIIEAPRGYYVNLPAVQARKERARRILFRVVLPISAVLIATILFLTSTNRP